MAGALETPAENLRAFFRSGRKIRYKKEEIIVGTSNPPNGVYFIDQGFIKIYSISNRGEEYVHIVYKPGEIFPLVWALKNIQPNIFYEAINDVVVWRMPKNRFLEYIKSDANAAYSVLEQMADQLNTHIDRIDNLEYRRAGERVAYRLLSLAKRFGENYKGKIIINAPITHQLIADSINLTRESVSRVIEKLEKKEIISYSEHKIIIKDAARLSAEFDSEFS